MVTLSICLSILVLMATTRSHIEGKRKWDKLDPEISFFYPGGHYIMLTFNDALDGTLTPKLLDMLKERKARVTMFVQGSKINENKEVLKRVVSERHEVGNYGWDLSAESASPADEEIVEQVTKCGSAIEAAVGKKSSVYRPPSVPAKAFKYESKHAELISSGGPQHAHAHQVILHSLDADEGGTKTNIEEIKSTLLNKAKKGDVIMCTLSEASIQASAALIDKLMEEGYEFLTLSEMMSFPDDKPH